MSSRMTNEDLKSILDFRIDFVLSLLTVDNICDRDAGETFRVARIVRNLSKLASRLKLVAHFKLIGSSDTFHYRR